MVVYTRVASAAKIPNSVFTLEDYWDGGIDTRWVEQFLHLE